MASLHINAKKEDFAKIVLMPGDPLRAKYIADTYLTNVKKVCDQRGMLGFTGYTKNGKRISIMSSGMGIPSIGIYSYELFNDFDVDIIIRIGTCGTYQKDIMLGDIVLAISSCTDSNFANQFELNGTFNPCADFVLSNIAYCTASKLGSKVHAGAILSADTFYDYKSDTWEKWAELGVLGVEMESYGLYVNAARCHKKALTILTATDHFLTGERLENEDRVNGLNKMIETAILTAEKFC